jgi:putative hydrolase
MARNDHGPSAEPEDAGAVALASAGLKEALRFLDRGLAPRQKARAFQRAVEVVEGLDDATLTGLVDTGRLQELDGIGPSTGGVIADAVTGTPSEYVARLDEQSRQRPGPGADLFAALRGDLHSHTTWSDGGAPLEEMARAAQRLGHEYLAITDHSPRLTIAHGLNPKRLVEQLDVIERLNDELAPFRILTGMEVDILVDGSLDLPEELLARLDVVVASVHSKLRLPEQEMTRRMVLAVSSPHVDVLGHCTGRQVVGTGRAPSRFDADLVFAACAQFGTAVEVNCRPERQDPPEELLERALDWGCYLSIDTDAHAPGQLEWQPSGCDKVATLGGEDRVINTWDASTLLDWCGSHAA